MLGQGVMTWFGLRLYEAALWAPDDRLDWRRPFALDIRYARAFSGARLARASADEMKRLGMRDSARLARWQAEMAAVFPDVEAGDHITGLYRPGEGAEFFHNGQLAGRIDDPEFARTFFGIWLDPRTREPDLRADLLGAR
ncbi:MAG: hypothetical protein GC151_11370 [Betaproteobacteria bacterium]|nr:hypothetical protein [Betaproteobacteria bacterium]